MRSEVQLLLDPPFHPVVRRDRHGALAQLGERLICIQKVIGSIPIGSTNAAALQCRGRSDPVVPGLWRDGLPHGLCAGPQDLITLAGTPGGCVWLSDRKRRQEVVGVQEPR